MEQIETGKVLQEAGAIASASNSLEKDHEDLDVFEGCPRELFIGGVKCVQKAWMNKQFSEMAKILMLHGFSSCDTEKDLDDITVEQIYLNLAIASPFYLAELGKESLEHFLYSLMDFGEVEPPAFEFIALNEFKAFLGILIEQNNLVQTTRKFLKKNLRALHLLT
jgi:hypothetical protein